MAGKKNWIADATKNKGGLHRSLGVPADKDLTAKQIDKAANSSNPKVAKQGKLAQTLRTFKKG